MRCAVGRLLDNWLVDEDNMTLWESEKGMVTADRRVLISKLVAQANEETLKNDEMHISCFLRTGMLVTLDGSEDDKIKPQGLTIPFEMPDEVDSTSSNDDEDAVVNSQCDWDKDVEDGIYSSDNDNINEADVVVDEEDESKEQTY